MLFIYEPVHEETNNMGPEQVQHKPSCTSTRWLEAGNFGFRKERNCTIRVAKTKALMSFAVTAKLTCAFVFAYADCWFSHAAADIELCSMLSAKPYHQWRITSNK